MYRDIKNFPNLTPLRFCAAYLVVIFHVEETRKMFGLRNLTNLSLFTQGPLAVTFFFVLSGFLITYLLLREQTMNRQVNVPRFYMRRILKIWPLYFFVVFIGLVLIPAGVKLGHVRYDSPYRSAEVAPYFLLFVPFVVNLKFGNHFLTPLWSVGVEEIYYFVWAPIVKWLRKHLLFILSGTVFVKTMLTIWAHYTFQNTLIQESLRMLQFEAMAAGGLSAYLIFHRTRPLAEHWLFAQPTQWALISLLMVRLFFHHSASQSLPLYATIFDQAIFSPLLLMAIFAWLILNLAVNERSIIRLESRVLHYLGDISYGIYMYHALAISLVVVPFRKAFLTAPLWQSTLILHVVVATFTLLCAAASKTFFENKFLRYKQRFQPICADSPSIGQSDRDATLGVGSRAA